MTDEPTPTPVPSDPQTPQASQPSETPAGAAPAPTPTPADAPEAQPVAADAPTEAAAVAAPQTEAAADKPRRQDPYIWGTGRRKASVARVRIRPGEGKFVVNRKEVDEYFRLQRDRETVRRPLHVAGAERTYDVFVNVSGGGTTGQSGAIMLGLARALSRAQPDVTVTLRDAHLLTRDPRCVERKKYGQRGARRRFQFSKR